eukprot:6105721-Amphidinium_carterae.1
MYTAMASQKGTLKGIEGRYPQRSQSKASRARLCTLDLEMMVRCQWSHPGDMVASPNISHVPHGIPAKCTVELFGQRGCTPRFRADSITFGAMS